MLVISATKGHKRDLEILADRLGYRHGERPNICNDPRDRYGGITDCW